LTGESRSGVSAPSHRPGFLQKRGNRFREPRVTRVGPKGRELRLAAAGGEQRRQKNCGAAEPHRALSGPGTLEHSSKMRARQVAQMEKTSPVYTPPIASRLPQETLLPPSSGM